MCYNINDIMDVLSESTVDNIFINCDFNLFTEGEKIDKLKEIKDKAVDKTKQLGKKAMDSSVVKASGKVYNAATEFPGEIVGRIAYGKKLSKDAPPDVIKEYQQKMIKVIKK